MRINYLHSFFFASVLSLATSISAQNGVALSPKLFLAGNYQSNGLMSDQLRAQGLLPLTEPYSGLPNFSHAGVGGGEVISDPSVLLVTGPNAIVDWVVVELRNPAAPSEKVSTRSALLQRDGDVVDLDGQSPVSIPDVSAGSYHIAVRHRNHFGVMTQLPIQLSNIATAIDFTNPNLPLYGNAPCHSNGTIRRLWLGDANHDKKAILQGPTNDIFYLFSAVLSASGNSGQNANYILQAYHLADLNLDGQVIYSGPNNDRAPLFLQTALNFQFLNYIATEQIP